MKVLLGIGGTEDSFRALERVVERTREAGDELTVAVLENPASDVQSDAVEERVRRVVDERGLGDVVDVRHLAGEPGPELVALAEDEGYDQLVLGGGKRSPMGKISLGHVSEYVLLNARITVKLVR